MQRFDELTPAASVAGGKQRDAPTVTAGSVDLPSERTVRGGDVDHRPGLRSHELGVQAGLGVVVAPHRVPEGREVGGEDRITCVLGGGAQLVEEVVGLRVGLRAVTAAITCSWTSEDTWACPR